MIGSPLHEPGTKLLQRLTQQLRFDEATCPQARDHTDYTDHGDAVMRHHTDYADFSDYTDHADHDDAVIRDATRAGPERWADRDEGVRSTALA